MRLTPAAAAARAKLPRGLEIEAAEVLARRHRVDEVVGDVDAGERGRERVGLQRIGLDQLDAFPGCASSTLRLRAAARTRRARGEQRGDEVGADVAARAEHEEPSGRGRAVNGHQRLALHRRPAGRAPATRRGPARACRRTPASSARRSAAAGAAARARRRRPWPTPPPPARRPSRATVHTCALPRPARLAGRGGRPARASAASTSACRPTSRTGSPPSIHRVRRHRLRRGLEQALRQCRGRLAHVLGARTPAPVAARARRSTGAGSAAAARAPARARRAGPGRGARLRAARPRRASPRRARRPMSIAARLGAAREHDLQRQAQRVGRRRLLQRRASGGPCRPPASRRRAAIFTAGPPARSSHCVEERRERPPARPARTRPAGRPRTRLRKRCCAQKARMPRRNASSPMASRSITNSIADLP